VEPRCSGSSPHEEGERGDEMSVQKVGGEGLVRLRTRS